MSSSSWVLLGGINGTTLRGRAYLCLPCRQETASKSLVAGLRMMWASSRTILQQQHCCHHACV